MVNIDINISILLKEYAFLERFDQAKRLGFAAVEFYWNRDESPKEVVNRIQVAGLQVAAFNFDAGDMAGGDRGLLSDPDRQKEVRENVPTALELAHRVGCKKLTALAGNLKLGVDRVRQLDIIRENLKWVCNQAAQADITVLVEAINGWDNKQYPFTNTHDTLEFLDSVGASNLKYLYDIYHMQRMEGNLAATLEKNLDQIGHIQIADSPSRHQPGTGEINYQFVFEVIDRSGYNGYVGLEYNPAGSTEESLAWLPERFRTRLDPNEIIF